MKILLVDGTIFGRKTGVLLETIQQSIEKYNANYEVEILAFSKLQHQILDGSPLNDDMKYMIQQFEQADAYIFASPIFQASIPGVLKNAFDMIPPKAMRYKPAAMVANGGTTQHHMVIEYQLKPILDYFRTLVTPNYVYTHSAHFNEQNEIIDANVLERLDELARVFVQYCEMSQGLKQPKLEV